MSWEVWDCPHCDAALFWKEFGAAMSSSPREGLWNGNEDVAAPARGLGLERGGDVFIAVERGFGERATRTSPPRSVRDWILGWRGIVEGGEWRAFQ